MKRTGLGLIAILFLLLISACGSGDSAYDQGIKALHDKDLDAATKAFNQAIDDDEAEADEAAQYIEMIDQAESISPFLEDEAYDDAVDAYGELKIEDHFADIYFIIADDIETLDEIITSQADIDGQLAMMKELIDAKIEALPIYEELLEKISKEKYLSEAQAETIKSLEKDIKALKGDDDETSDEAEDDKDDSSDSESDDSDDDADDESNESNDGAENDNSNNNGSEQASDQAYTLAYNYVIEQGIVSKSMLDNGNVKLNMDHQDGSGAYIFQLFEVVSDGGSGHTATWGWYTVDVESGTVSEAY